MPPERAHQALPTAVLRTQLPHWLWPVTFLYIFFFFLSTTSSCSRHSSSSAPEEESRTTLGRKRFMAFGSMGDGSLERVKGPWTSKEDDALRRLVQEKGACNWPLISRSIPGRSGKSCRLRWGNRLSAQAEGRPFTAEEDEAILHARARFGDEWAVIALLLSGRTGNAVKKHWDVSLKRKLSNSAASYDVADGPLPKRSTAGPPASDVSNCRHHSEIFPPPRGGAGFIPPLVDLSSIEVGGEKMSCPATTLSLSPPGSDPCAIYGCRLRQRHLEELPCENGDPAPGGNMAKLFPCLVFRDGEPRQQSPLGAELRALVQELIRKEVRNYISEL